MSITRNTTINLVGAIVPMAVMLITVPLYLAHLGEARYGVLALVWLVLGYFSFLEMGLGKATANQIAKSHDGTNTERSEIFWTALLLNTAMGVIGACILWLVGEYLLTSVLKMPPDFRQEAITALPWLIASLPIALTSAVLNGALEGRNRFFTVNALQVGSNTIFQLTPLIAAYYYSPSLEVVIPVAILSRVLMYLPFFFACYKAVPCSFVPNFSMTRAKSLFQYGGWVSVTGIVTPIVETLDRFLVGAIIGAQATAHYTIAYQLTTKIRIIPASLTRALFPRLSSDVTNPTHLAEKSLKFLLPILTLIIVIAIFSAQPFLELWLGQETGRDITPTCLVFLIGVWANSLAYIPYSLLQAGGKPKLVALIHLAELLPFIAILYFATANFGVLGAAAAWSLRASADAMLLYIAAHDFSKIFLKLIIPFLIILLASFAAMQNIEFEIDHWTYLAITLMLVFWLEESAGIMFFRLIKKFRK